MKVAESACDKKIGEIDSTHEDMTEQKNESSVKNKPCARNEPCVQNVEEVVPETEGKASILRIYLFIYSCCNLINDIISSKQDYAVLTP